MNIQEIFTKAIKKKASDVHLVVGLNPIIRIDGELEFLKDEKIISEKNIEQMIFLIIDDEQKQKFLEKKDLDFSYTFNNKDRLRINLKFEKGNMGLVARIINQEMPSLDDINILEVVKDLLDLNQGLILVTGPTGCGKSTTLAAMINHINNNRRCNIITLEDPIEYIFTPQKGIITQRQLGSDMISFDQGLKHALRQDPDVIMVGEMRDLETISSTITLAETGHLVMATLHTYSAAQTIDRIIDTFPPHQQNQVRMQLSMTLAAVISQRLLPKINGGQIAVRETLINTSAVSNLIRENKVSQIKSVIETSSKQGMISMDQDIKRLYRSKMITKETARMHMDNPGLLEKFKLI